MTPPPKLLKQWEDDWFQEQENADVLLVNAYAAGALAGADAELEACCALLQQKGVPAWSLLRMHRRPKPPSLKEQALAELAEWENVMDIAPDSPIRRALEQIDD
jgi:hypothetical protein